MSKQDEIIDICNSMVSEKINLIEGCRIIISFISDDDRDSELYSIFRCVDSETDHFPFGDVRKNYSEKSLDRIDSEIQLYLSEVKKEILSACMKILKNKLH